MRMLYLTIVLILSISTIHGQIVDLSVLPEMVELSKKAAVPILCRDPSWPIDSFQYGTAVMIGDGKRIVALTCEHVLAVKDSLNRTIRYLSDIIVNLNRIDSMASSIKMTIVYVDETNDFAVLAINPEKNNIANAEEIFYKYITVWQCKRTSEIREGEPILYIGYPMSFGIGYKNYPLSRLGIISQIVPRQSYFLIDGFVQHGHSGSPVFLIRGDEKGTHRSLIGIARGYPEEYVDIVQKTIWTPDSSQKAIVNPGFSVITSMDVILPVLMDSLYIGK